MANERDGRPGRGRPFVGTVVSVQEAAPGRWFALGGFEATAVVQVAPAADGEGRPDERAAIVLYGGSVAGLRGAAVVTVHAIRAGTYTHRDGGLLTTWAVFYAHSIAPGRGRPR